MLALTGTTGKIGGAVLKSILDEDLIPVNELVICASSNPTDGRWDLLKSQGARVRRSDYSDPDSLIKAFSGCSKVFLVSTPRIEMDYNDAPPGEGREKHHINAVEAAQKAGVKHIYYTSLAFGSESKAGVMQAHLRTEAFLRGLNNISFTIIREGLYNESWPLYFGYYDLKDDDRKEVVVAGDGPISWTSIADLGLSTALVVTESSTEYTGKTLHLSASKSITLKDIATIVTKVKGKEVILSVVSRDQYIEYYVQRGKERGHVEWWVSSYAALVANECFVKDGTLKELLSRSGKVPKPVEETVKEMLGS